MNIRKDDDVARLRETLRRRAEAEAQTGHKWETRDTVALVILLAKLDALSYEDRRRGPEPAGW